MRNAVLLLVAAASAAVLGLLGPHAIAAVQGATIARLEDAVTGAAAVLATALATWYLATALLGLLAALLRAGGRALDHRQVARARGGRAIRAGAALLEGAVRRFGAPLLRHGAALGLGLGLAVGGGPALATSPPAGEVPLDLRPGADVAQPQEHDVAPPTQQPTGAEEVAETQRSRPAAAAVPEPSDQPPSAGPSQDGPTAATPMATTPATDAAPAPAADSASAPALGSTRTPTVGSAPGPTHGSVPAAGATGETVPTVSARHTVVPGESLWQIAADRLGPAASDAAVAREWPRWYAANAATIGPDPHLIHPGQQLLAPPKEVGP